MDNQMNECKTLIKQFPLFVLLNDNDLEHLAALMEKKHLAPNEIIVRENEVVDGVYLIADGKAKVTRKHVSLQKEDILQLGVLQKGDCIGLTHTTFFSPTSLRTATVTTVTPMTLYGLSVISFYNFLRNTSQRYPALNETAEKILLINFIKSNGLYNELSNDEILNIVARANKISLPANTILFEKGETAEQCYILLNGSVMVSDGSQFKKATQGDALGAQDFFAGQPYHESVKTQSDADFFVLSEKSNIDTTSSSFFERIINYIKRIF